jgi:hypothetical protein
VTWTLAWRDVAQAETGPTLPLAVQGGLSASNIDVGESFSFSLTMTNVSTNQLDDLRIAHIGGQDVELTAVDWCSARGLSWQILRACTVSKTLPPGRSITVHGTLRTAETGRSNIAAVIDWRTTAAPSGNAASVTSTAVFPLGTIDVESAVVRRTGYVVNGLASLGLPIVGGIIALLIKRIDDRRQTAEKERAEKSEAGRLMLPVSHRYGVKYYAHLENLANTSIQYIAPLRQAAIAAGINAPPQDPLSAQVVTAFYPWLMLNVRRAALLKEGAYYFKNHVGEIVVVNLFRAYSQIFVSEGDGSGPPAASAERRRVRDLLNRVSAAVKISETSDGLLMRLDYEQKIGNGSLKELADWFAARVTRVGVEEAMDYLGAYSAFLALEMNRPYEHWYEKPVELAIEPKYLAALFRMLALRGPQDPEVRQADRQIDEYLKGAGLSDEAIAAARKAAK